MKTDPTRAEQDAEILRLRCSGLSLRAIAARVDLSHQTVSNRIEDAITELVSPEAEQWRALETARLDDLTQRAYGVLDSTESDDTALKAIAQLERLSASRRKLWALDMPQPIDVALSGRLDVEGEVVVGALKAAFDALELSPEQQAWAAYAASASMYAASGQEPPAPPPPRPSPSPTAVVEVPVAEPDLMADFRQFAEREGFDPDGLDDDEEDDDDE